MGGVAPIADKMITNKLRGFGPVYRRSVDAVVRKTDMGTVEGSINRRG